MDILKLEYLLDYLVKRQKGEASPEQAVDSLMDELYNHIEQMHKVGIIIFRIDVTIVKLLTELLVISDFKPLNNF